MFLLCFWSYDYRPITDQFHFIHPCCFHCSTSTGTIMPLALEWHWNNPMIEIHDATLQWHHNEHDGVSNHQPHHCLLNRLSRRRSKKTSKLCVTGLCAGNSLVTGEFPAQIAGNAKKVSIWRRHQETDYFITDFTNNNPSNTEHFQTGYMIQKKSIAHEELSKQVFIMPEFIQYIMLQHSQ